MCESPRGDIRLTSRMFSAHNNSMISLALMVALMCVSHVMRFTDHPFAADVLLLPAFLCLTANGIAVMFIPSDLTLMRNIGVVVGILLTCVSSALCFFLARMIIGCG